MHQKYFHMAEIFALFYIHFLQVGIGLRQICDWVLILKKEENNSTIKYRVFIIANELINAYSYFEDSDINDTNQSN